MYKRRLSWTWHFTCRPGQVCLALSWRVRYSWSHLGCRDAVRKIMNIYVEVLEEACTRGAGHGYCKDREGDLRIISKVVEWVVKRWSPFALSADARWLKSSPSISRTLVLACAATLAPFTRCMCRSCGLFALPCVHLLFFIPHPCAQHARSIIPLLVYSTVRLRRLPIRSLKRNSSVAFTT